MIRNNPNGDHPKIHSSAYIDPSAVVIGAVTIGKNVYVGPGAVVRADEKESSISIGDGCNIQDRVIVHAHASTEVIIKTQVSLAHGCIIHGPCVMGKNCFIGFGSVVYGAVLEESVFVKHLAVIENARIPKGSVISNKAAVVGKENHRAVPAQPAFARKTADINIMLAKGYRTKNDKKD